MRTYNYRGSSASLYRAGAPSFVPDRTAIPQSVLIGTTDITAAALYGVGGKLDGKTLVLILNGFPDSLTLSGLSNVANEAALLAAIGVAFAGITATQGPGAAKHLVLKHTAVSGIAGFASGPGTANALLGLSTQRVARIGPTSVVVVTL